MRHECQRLVSGLGRVEAVSLVDVFAKAHVKPQVTKPGLISLL
jgi:hypothetical protein